jgi:hypothetical protein
VASPQGAAVQVVPGGQVAAPVAAEGGRGCRKPALHALAQAHLALAGIP